jgi:hypothetical protein
MRRFVWSTTVWSCPRQLVRERMRLKPQAMYECEVTAKRHCLSTSRWNARSISCSPDTNSLEAMIRACLEGMPLPVWWRDTTAQGHSGSAEGSIGGWSNCATSRLQHLPGWGRRCPRVSPCVAGPVCAVTCVRIRRDWQEPVEAANSSLRSLSRRIATLDQEIAELDRQLEPLVRRTAPRAVELFGIGIGHSTRMLVTAGQNIGVSAARQPPLTSVALDPIPASSGKIVRHRLNPGGDRRYDSSLHMIAVVRLRYCERSPVVCDSPTRASAQQERSDSPPTWSRERSTRACGQILLRFPRLDIYLTPIGTSRAVHLDSVQVPAYLQTIALAADESAPACPLLISGITHVFVTDRKGAQGRSRQ